MAPKPRKMFAEAYPELVQFWSPKNIKGPDEVGFESVQEVWWEVPGFEPFRKTVRTVGRSGYAAPMQRPKHSIADEPSLADEFSDDNRLPANFVGRSRKDHFNWVCRDCGTKWTAAPFTRWNGMHGCPRCTEEAKAPERAALQALRDERQKIRDERKALGKLKSRLRKAHTQLKVEQKRRDNAVAAEQRRLQQLRATKSSLAHVRPDIAAELVGVDPSTISARSGISQTWRGQECGHEWVAKPHDRVGKNSGCPVCAGRLIIPGTNDIKTLFPYIADEWSDLNDVPVETISPGSNTTFWWKCSDCGNEWQTQPNYRCFQGYGCPACFRRGRSRAEEELYEYVLLRVGHFDPERNVKGILSGQQEVDVFVPELNIAFEYNGLHWHAENRKRTRTYHHDKVVEARKNGVRLIHIWEDDWERRRWIVEQMIDAILGVDDRPKVGARECTVEETTRSDATEFLTKNHLLGAPRVIGKSYGLRYRGELVAVLLAKRRNGGYEITRYATSMNVRGGFTRLLSRLEGLLSVEGGGTITTFSDNAHSDGNLYEVAGFVRDGELAPDYMYTKSHGERQHKFNYRKSKFKTNPSLKYKEGLTEAELAGMNKLFRVYDAGKVRWVKQVPAAD